LSNSTKILTGLLIFERKRKRQKLFLLNTHKKREKNSSAASIERRKKKKTMALQAGVSTSKVLILVGAGRSPLSHPSFPFSYYIYKSFE
jgi:hypothetical protein